MSRYAVISLLLLPMVTAWGCANTVLFSTWTTTGIEINGAEGTQSAKLGYERFEGVVMPDRTRHVVDDGDGVDAYPVASRYRLKSGSVSLASLGSVKIYHVFASGEAAVQEGVQRSLENDFNKLVVGLGEEVDVDHAQEIRRMIDAAGDPEKASMLAAVSDVLGDGSTLSPGRARILIGEAVDAKRSSDLEKLHARIKKIVEGD
jgi:hypothetical protein